MAITLGTPTSIDNQTGTTGYTFAHTTAANTKALVVVVTGADSSDTDAVIQGVTFNGIVLESVRTYRVNPYQIAIWYLKNPPIGAHDVIVTHGGTNTDSQATAIGLISSSADTILKDNYAESTTGSTTTHTLVVNPAKTGSVAIGGIVDIQTAITALSVTANYGTEISGSEADMGSQVVGCASRSESGGTAEIRWTKSANAISYALIHTFYEQNYPTVALNTPNDTATGVSLTPDLIFTGTDTQSDTIEYEVQVDTVNTFNSQSTSFNLKYVDFKIAKVNSPTDNLTVRLYQTNPSGTLLGTSNTVAGSGVNGIVRFTFATPITIALDTVYCLTVLRDTLSSSNYYSFYVDTNKPYLNGVGWYSDGTWKVATTYDSVFAIYDENLVLKTAEPTTGVGYLFGNVAANTGYGQDFLFPSIPKIDKLSSVPDATFADVDGSDTHPFDSANQIKYTVQSANILTELTTYYWRVRAIDPSGSNTWGAWATTRSFTTLSSGPKPGLAELTLEGFAPTVAVTQNRFIDAGLGELTLEGFAPTVFASDKKEVTAGLGELTLEGFAPTVTISDNKSVSPGLGELIFEGFAPTVEAFATYPIESLIYSLTGAPWLRYPAKGGLNTDGLDYSKDGSPWWAKMRPSGWATKSLKAYLGGTWIAKPLKKYIGGVWTEKETKQFNS